MINLLATVLLLALCNLGQDAMAVPEDDIFQITRASEIEKTGTTQKKFVFKDTMTYTFNAALSGKSFTLTLKKEAPTETNVYRTGGIVAFGIPGEIAYNARQLAFYKNDELTAFLAERCDADANNGEGACVLTGAITYNNQAWSIESLNETHYNGMGTDKVSDSISAIKDAANNWKNGVKENADSETHSVVKRDIHDRHRRDTVTTTCNIFEVVAVADATVWEYFLERNNGNETFAEADLRTHYDALFREIDLIFSCLPDHLCLRVYLVDVLIQKNASTDWTLLTASGNVDLITSLPRCALFNFAHADAPFCFTRKMIQFGTITAGIRGSGRFSSACSNETIEAAVLEDNHDGLARLGALVVAVIINSDILSCTTSAEVNNTFRADDSASTEPSDPTDYSITYTFSNCSVNALKSRIELLNNQSNNCLLQGNLTDEQFNSLASHRRLAGEIVALNHQCQLAFGLESKACDLYNFTTGHVIPNTATCGAGAFCTNNGTCGINQTIVYSGTSCGCNKICYKGVCRADFDCGGLPLVPNGFFTSDGDTSFLATAHLNCCPNTGLTGNVTIKCLRTGWQSATENCTGPVITTTTTPSTTSTPPTTSNFGIFPG